MANNLKSLSEADRERIAYSTEIYDVLVAAYNAREQLLNYVRKATSVTEAIDRAARAKSDTDDLIHGLDGTVARTGATLSDARAAREAAKLEGAEGICKDGQRWDPITQTCVPVSPLPV